MNQTTLDENPGALKPALGAQQPVGHDADRSRRPGVPRLHAPERLPNVRYPPERQRSDVTVFMHGRPHKDFPPVFGTAVPPKLLSGLIRRAAYRHPDHAMRHWTLLLFADRVDSWEHRAGKLLRVAAPFLALAALGAGLRRGWARPARRAVERRLGWA